MSPHTRPFSCRACLSSKWKFECWFLESYCLIPCKQKTKQKTKEFPVYVNVLSSASTHHACPCSAQFSLHSRYFLDKLQEPKNFIPNCLIPFQRIWLLSRSQNSSRLYACLTPITGPTNTSTNINCNGAKTAWFIFILCWFSSISPTAQKP